MWTRPNILNDILAIFKMIFKDASLMTFQMLLQTGRGWKPGTHIDILSCWLFSMVTIVLQWLLGHLCGHTLLCKCDKDVNSGLSFCEGEQPPVRLCCCNTVYISPESFPDGWGGIMHQSCKDWIQYPISPLQSHAHITPFLNSQWDPLCIAYGYF